MTAIHAIDPSNASGRTKELLDMVQKRTGRIPNMVAFMANSPVVLGAHVSLAGAYHDATLASELRELVAAAVAERSGCDYTLSAACQTALALCKTP